MPLPFSAAGPSLPALAVVLTIAAGAAAAQPAADQAAAGAGAATAAGPGLGVQTAHQLGEPLGEPLADAELDQALSDVARDIRCPKCQALSIADSAAQSAQAMREQARSLLAAGYTREQVVGYFEQRYGEFVLLEPRARGLNLVVWAAPAAILAVGALVVVVRIRRRRGPSEEALDAWLEQVDRETAS